MYVRVWKFLEEYSLLLVLGALIALFWANLSYEDYHHVGHMVLLSNSYVGQVIDGQRVLTLHYLINDVLMPFFFAIPGKEIWEGIILKNGSLKGKKALTPLVATFGGIIGPVVVYLLIAVFLDSFDTLKNGWAISTSTDIAFSYLVGRLIFGSGHPAVAFLLLLAVADDALDLIKSSGSGNNTVLSFPYDAANQESVKDFFDEVKKVSKRVDYLVHAI